jgi:hypothetical protein
MTLNRKTLVVFAMYCVASAALLGVVVKTAFAGEQDFTLVNKTGIEIHKVFISPHNSDEWGEDILGKDTLSDGDSVDITFGKREKAAHWDLRVEDGKGHSVTWESLNLLEISKVTIHLNDGKATADIE